MKRILKHLSVITFSLMLFFGCTGYKGLNTRAEMNKASLAGVQTGKGDWPSEKWWEGFNDPQLDSLIEEALKGNPSLKEAQARIRVAKAASGIIDSANSVQVYGDAASTYQRFPEHESYPPQHAGDMDTVNRVQVAAGYNFDLWGKNRAEYMASLGEIKVAEIESEAAKLTLTSALALEYIRLDKAYRISDLMKKQLETLNTILELHKKRYTAGLAPEDLIKRTESLIESVRANIKRVDEDITRQKILLGSMTGKGIDAGLSIERPVINIMAEIELPSDLPAELIGRRPDIAAQKWRIEAIEQRIDSAKADFYPNINLNAFAGFRSIGLDNLLRSDSSAFGIGPAITLPIFNGGRLKSSLAMKNAQYDQSVERYNSLILKAVQEVADIAVSGSENMKQLTHREKSVSSLQESERLASLNYKSGLTGALPLLNAKLSVINAESSVIELQSRQGELLVSMNRALGGGSETYQEKIKEKD